MGSVEQPRASVPMSPLPARPDGRQPTGSHRSVTVSDAAAFAVPHEDDDSPAAVAWRARRGERIAVETRAGLHHLATAFEAFTTRIAETDARWSKRWTTLGRIGWPVLIALCIMAACGLAGLTWSIVARVRLDPPALPQVAAPR